MEKQTEAPEYTKTDVNSAKEVLAQVISMGKANIKRLEERIKSCSSTTYVVRVTATMTAGVDENGAIKVHSNIEAQEMSRSLAKKVMDANFNRPVTKRGKTVTEKFKPYAMEIAKSHFIQMKDQEEKTLSDNRSLIKALV